VRGNFAGTIDDVFCNAIQKERAAGIALVPGLRWGARFGAWVEAV